jgi:hypothetical protein
VHSLFGDLHLVQSALPFFFPNQTLRRLRQAPVEMVRVSMAKDRMRTVTNHEGVELGAEGAPLRLCARLGQANRLR